MKDESVYSISADAVCLPRNELHMNSDVSCEFEWCLHCYRAFRSGMRRIVEESFRRWELRGLHTERRNYQYCPFDDCDGSAIDIHPWVSSSGFCKSLIKMYGSIPEEGKVYDLYPEGWEEYDDDELDSDELQDELILNKFLP